MKMRFMRHWSINKGTKPLKTVHDVVRHPHSVALSHDSSIVFSTGLNKAGYRDLAQNYNKAPLTMKSVQILLAQAAGPGDPMLLILRRPPLRFDPTVQTGTLKMQY